MARPRNDELKEKIELASWALFRERGYDAASYAAIAQACGISRNLVQYHFQKKELLAIRFMERILEEAQDALGIDSASLQDDFRAMHAIGTCYFTFLLQDQGYRTFLHDIIRSRDLTESILTFNTDWALGRVSALANAEARDAVVRSVIVHMGGFYELLYHCLKSGEPFNPNRELLTVMRAFMSSLGHGADEVERTLGNGVGNDAVTRAVRAMNKRMPV